MCYRCVHVRNAPSSSVPQVCAREKHTKLKCDTGVCTWETHQAQMCYRCVHMRNTPSSRVLQVCTRDKHTKLQCATGVCTWETPSSGVLQVCAREIQMASQRRGSKRCSFQQDQGDWLAGDHWPFHGEGNPNFPRGNTQIGHWCINTTTTTTTREANTSLESLLCIQCHTHFDWHMFSLKLFVF